MLRNGWNKIAIVYTDVFPHNKFRYEIIKNASKQYGIEVVNEYRFDAIIQANGNDSLL